MPEFPHLVQMHERYAQQGMVFISVSVDEPKDAGKALDFLQKQKAVFVNFLLDEDGQFWQDKWNIKGPLAVFVFDRQGKRARKFDNDDPDNQYTYADVEQLVKTLLNRDRKK
jgi:hypothetical protein